jgi:hypothetical protein
MNKLSLLRAAGKVQLQPYPHLVIDNCLPESIYYQLLNERPSAEWILHGRDPGNNKRIDLSAIQCMQKGISGIWLDFITYHTSNEFWQEVLNIFGDYIQLAYPQLRINGLLDMKPGVRGATKKPFWLDCNVGLNTPCDGESSVRGPHIDNPVELFAGLLYMGAGEGGDLVVSRLVKPPRFYGKMEIEEDCVEAVKVVKYRHNQFVFFLNTPLSVHSVTPRNSKDYRKLVNVIGEYNFPLFKVQR